VARLAIPVAVRWADLDAYGHVNNVAVLRLLEEARVAAFWHPGDGEPPYPTAVLHAGPGAETTTVVAKHEVEYLAPFGHLRGGVVVELWVGHLGAASMDICYEVHDPAAARRGSPPGTASADDGATPADDGAAPPAVRKAFVRATSTLVMLDSRSAAPRRIGDTERAAWEPFVEEPVVHRRRS